MSNRNYDQGWAIGKRLMEISGSFGTNGASNPTAASVKGFGFGYAAGNTKAASPGVNSTSGVVHSGTGQYDVTFEDPYLDVNVASVDLQVASASANWAQPGPVSNTSTSATAPTLRLFTINSSGTAVDIGAGASSRVHFFVCFRDSTVQFSKP